MRNSRAIPLERIDRVLRLWAEGKTSNQVRDILGISRNAVIGIINRARAAGDERAVIRSPENSRSGGLRAMWLANEAKRKEAKAAALEARREAARARMEEALAIKTRVDEDIAATPSTSEVQVQHHRAVDALEHAAVAAARAHREEERVEQVRARERIRRAREETETTARMFAQGTVFKPRKPGLCQWIISGDTSSVAGAASLVWCSAKAKAPGCSWCAEHREIVFAKPRQPGAAQPEEAAA